MTILIIEGQEHDLTAALRQAEIGDLLDLLLLTKATAFEATNALPEGASWAELDAAVLEYFGEEEHLEAYGGMVFLCKRKAGEDLSYRDALKVRLNDVQFKRADDEEDDEADDPKGPSTPEDGSPDAEA